jgi:hypothetical protein
VAESKESREVVHADGEGDEKTLFPLAMGRAVDKGGTGRRAKLWAVRPWALATSVGKWQAVGHDLEPESARAVSHWLTGMGLGPK